MAFNEYSITVGYYQAAFNIKSKSVLITFKMEIWQIKERNSNLNHASMLVFVNDINRIRTTF